MKNKAPLFILDTSALIYRSHYAFARDPLTNDAGIDVSAIFGFFKSLHGLFEHYNPQYFVAALDSRASTFRHEMYEDYKATRSATPPELSVQIPIIEKVAADIGIPLLRYDGFEADDIIATLATLCKKAGQEAVIISSDKDLMQLIDDTVVLLKQDRGGGWSYFGSADVEKKWKVKPAQILDFLSLLGDASDNVPGVSGIGETRASRLIQQYGSLDEIYAHTEELKGVVKRSIIDGKENAYFSRKLIELVCDMPIEGYPERFSTEGLQWQAAADFFMQENMPSLSRLFEAKAHTSTSTEKKSNSPSQERLIKAREVYEPKPSPLAEFERAADFVPSEHPSNYHCVSDATELNARIDEAIASGCVAFDTETTSVDALTADLVGFSFAFEAGTAYYVPLKAPAPELGSEAPALVSRDDAAVAVQKLFASSCRLLLHNAKFDLHVLYANNIIHQLPDTVFDTMIACWLLEPDRRSFSLDSLANDLLGFKTILYADIVPKGSVFSDVDVATATRYAAEDADMTLQLYQLLEPKLQAFELSDLFYQLEMPLLLLLAKMEGTGMNLDTTALIDFSKELEKDIADCEHRIFTEVGYEFNVASPKQLQRVLFEERGLTPGKKTKTGYSTASTVLQNLASEDIVVGEILDYRAMSKLRSTYAESLPLLVGADGRVRTSFVQTGTATGRLSSRDPNLQNIPIRTEAGRRIRSAFCAGEGKMLISADYAQIELVILAHLSQDKNLLSSFIEGVDVHAKTAASIFGVAIDAVQPDMRRIAKTINFGVMYGMSAFRLANELRIPRAQAAGFIDSYFAVYSGVKAYMEGVKEEAKRKGFVETLMGRRRSVPGIYARNKNERAAAERLAINTPIQGTAADIVKKAMLAIERALQTEGLHADLLLQVHDELIFEVPSEDVSALSALIRREMEGVVELSLPLRVSIESGKSWGDFH